MKLEQSEVIRHLQLALGGDDKHLRTCVGKLLNVLTQKHAKQPGMPEFPIRWEQGKEGSLEYWDVTLQRRDAKTVEEIFADYRMRKNIPGQWRTFSKNGKLIPIKKDGPLITFRFVEVRPVIERRKKKAAKEINKKKKAKENLLQQFSSMSDEEREKVLAMLKSKL